MKVKDYIKYLLPALVFLVLSLLFESQLIVRLRHDKIMNNFKREIVRQEAEILSDFEVFLFTLSQGEVTDFFTTFSQYNDILSKTGHAYTIQKGDSLCYWTDNEITYYNHYPTYERGLEHFPNGYFYTWVKRFDDYKVTAYLHLKWEFPHQNKYLVSEFNRFTNLPSSYQIINKEQEGATAISNKKGEYLFSVLPVLESIEHDCKMRLPCIFLLLSFVAFLFGLKAILRRIKIVSPEVKLIFVTFIFATVYFTTLIAKHNGWLHSHSLFTARYFAYNYFFPSLGHYMILSLITVCWAFIFYKEFKLIHFKKYNKFLSLSILTLLHALIVIAIAYFQVLLFSNSTISFEFYNIVDLSIYSIIGIISVLILYAVYFFIAFRVIQYLRKVLSPSNFITTTLITGVIITIGCWQLEMANFATWGVFAIFFSGFLYMLKKERFSRHRLTYIVFGTFIVSIIFLFFMQASLERREREVMKIIAENLASEHDPTAEVLFQQVDSRLRNDTIVLQTLGRDELAIDSLLKQDYFDGFWRRYDLQTTVCSQFDSVVVKPDNDMHPCYSFFDEMIEQQGMPIQSSNFYFMDRMDGRISYLGRYRYLPSNSIDSVTIFIELVSKIRAEGIGFPELLLDEKASPSKNLEKYSSAKYFDGKLVDRRGEFTYNFTPDVYKEYIEGDGWFEIDRSEHYAFHFGKNNMIIVSKRHLFITEYLISFPYVFLSFFLLAIVITLSYGKRGNPISIKRELKLKIQTAIITVVIGSLLIVGGGTVYYTYITYQNKHEAELGELIQSVSIELEGWLQQEDTFDNNMQQILGRELYRLSDVFKIDINIYGLNGDLLASSRPQIYRKGLIARQMNAKAYVEMSTNRQREFIHPEQIGHLSFLSAYIPIVNDNGEYMAYVNLPYFTREDAIRQEISTFIVAFINIYVFLLLVTILVAVFVSNQITKPLVLIRDKLKSIKLRQKSEPIDYEGNDEIGSLIKEYNSKVEELQHSAELLAKSEREHAWREMAKQIAHEIKNPLTPMKLNIQYLRRAYDEQVDDFDHYLTKVTSVLIEQIDKLSTIATAFSNFAKIPKANAQNFKLIDVLEQVVSLFKANENITFAWKIEINKETEVFADHDQISRVFINLVKNGIQSISPERGGKIEIHVGKYEQWIKVRIIDNGIGVTPEIMEKLFMPNFTTKSSGTGLGLAISRNIIESAGGKIWCENNHTFGAQFIVMLPKGK